MIKRRKIYIVIIFSITVLALSISSCTIERMIDESYLSDEKIEAVPEIDIDEYEIISMETKDKNMVKSYEVELELLPKDEQLDNPFKPFYASGQEEDEDEEVIENTLLLKKIYSIEGVKYIDLELNGYMYKLVVGDIFNKIYQLQVINDASVVLLKGDSLITLFLNEVYID